MQTSAWLRPVVVTVVVAWLGSIASACYGSAAPQSPDRGATVTGPGIENIDDLSFENKVKMQEEIIRSQEKEIKRLENELQTLKLQDFYNECLKKLE